jgi:hypothetical protein
MKTETVVIRRDRETGRLVLFFVNRSHSPHQWWIECFDPEEGHSECSIDYMRACQPIKPRRLPHAPQDAPVWPADAVMLFMRWNDIPGAAEGVQFKLGRRLSYGMGGAA